MNRATHILAALALLSPLTACQPQDLEISNSEPVDRGLVLSLLTGTEIAGSYADDHTTIRFRATELELEVVEIDLEVGGQNLYAHIDLGHGEGFYDLTGVVLDEATRGAMEALHLALDAALTGEHMTRVEDQLLRSSAFLGVAPVGEKLGAREFYADKSWVYLSCGCYRKYIGNGYYRTAGKGSWCTGGWGNGCKGRCGIGCGWSGRGAYTRDCAKHDYGLGSWWSASDDFSFAGSNC
jgi:hypothetical protein